VRLSWKKQAELASIKTQSGSKARSRRPCTLQIKAFSAGKRLKKDQREALNE
jgi:hypothetical protein